MSIFQKHNINVVGTGKKTLLLVHGYGCDQNMWRLLVPAFQKDYRIVLFDHVGAGKSDISKYSREKYGTRVPVIMKNENRPELAAELAKTQAIRGVL